MCYRIVHRDDEHRVAFPVLSSRPRGPKSASHAQAKPHLEQRKPKIQNVYLQSGSRSRTPSLRNSRIVSRPTTPTTSITTFTNYRPQIQRANSLTGPASAGLPMSSSWTGIEPVPKSAKRWARTAHLHEVKSPIPSSVPVASSSRSVKNAKDVDGGEEEKENRGTVSALVKLPTFTPKDKAKALNVGDIGVETGGGRDIFIDEAPNRLFSRPRRLGRSNGHDDRLPPPILVIPGSHNRVVTSSDGVQQTNGSGIIQRWNTMSSSSVSSPGADGDDENLWVDTDTSVDGGNSSDVDGCFGS